MERVRKISETYPIFKQIQKMSNGQIKPEYSFIALASIIFVSLFCRCLAGAVTSAFSFLLIVTPATNIIVSKASPETANVKHILSYLLALALFGLGEAVFFPLIRRIPFYYHGKFLFFYYLSVRRTQLTDYLNASVFAPANDVIRKINQFDAKEVLKAAQVAASDRIKSSVEAVKEAKPSKEE
ncbi:uncharacterized protein NEMAJ01_0748 [Nematocida major]|uniref:uncharacterized protein n=1 Tax=Nematocida major TaxID=1912982 RepID=UPI0020077062|nr:uncharacterized protein NEMAJ01_0748 [Nematocida major]KAH9385852.1 hypothetical protein NEMAJ01_0748 [Nematocida major]